MLRNVGNLDVIVVAKLGYTRIRLARGQPDGKVRAREKSLGDFFGAEEARRRTRKRDFFPLLFSYCADDKS